MTAGFVVRSPDEEDWREARDLRLEMLADTPIAYLETLETALGHDEAYWRRRARPRTDGGITVVAVTDDGRWVGTMAGIPGAGGPTLVGVYVSPAFRGRRAGVTDALLDAVETWARGHADVLRLEVNELNARARAAYEQRGFVLTGRTSPYPLDPPSLELEMIKRL
ncbi:N-acetyltransferase [Amnibacterium sp.]|uniref:GNAT family N-acetyltransferase n=1 Tax=Amnibacterium sp. TaxID=1872496 RepID=UPI00260AE23B|nr:GNAT family N-acetyltransferase [Amnibacterium sp.]MCU1475039.1 family N-acetyltransferase [Amnibacterium sp.]